MRPRSILLATIALFVALVTTAAVMLRSMDLGPYRSLIAERVESATGRDLELDGEIHLALSLRPTIAVGDLALANAPWGSQSQMMVVRRLEAQLELLPLLSGKIRIHRIALIGVDMLLETDRTGRGNWSFGTGAEDTGNKPPDRRADGGLPSLPTVAEVVVEDATLTFRDGTSGAVHSIVLQRLTAKADAAFSPISLAAAGTVDTLPVTLSGRLGAPRQLLEGKPYLLDLQADIGGARVAIEGGVTAVAPDRDFAFRMSVAGNDLAELGTLLGVRLPAPGPYSLAGTLRPAGAASVKIESATARFGKSDLAGDLTVTWSGPRPKIEAALTSTVLDLADLGLGPLLTVPAGTSEATDGGAVGGRLFPADPLPFAWLHRVDAVVEIAGRRVRWRPFIFENARIDAVLEGGRLVVETFEAGWKGGTVSAALTVDAVGLRPSLDGSVTGRHVVIGALLRRLGLTDGLSGGATDFDLDLHGGGDSIRAIAAALDGTARFHLGPGRITDRSGEIALIDSVGLVDLDEAAAGPNVHCMAGRLTIADGKAVSRGLVIDTNSAVVIGEGRVDLGTESLDIRLEPHAKQVSLMSLGTPLIVGGTLLRPTVAADTTGLAVGAAAAAVATGATGGIAGIVAALIAGGVAAVETAADNAPRGGQDRCSAVLAELDADAESEESASPERSNRRFRR